MFSDLYGLTEAVLDGRKTQTRRIAYKEPSSITAIAVSIRKEKTKANSPSMMEMRL